MAARRKCSRRADAPGEPAPAPQPAGAALARLRQVSTRLVRAGDRTSLLAEIVDAAIALTAADMGNIQVLDRRSGALKIAASRGFARPFLKFFNAVHEGEAACGTALRGGERVVVEDVTTSPVFAAGPARDALLSAGVRAVQTTPLVGRSGRLVGMLSTHYRTPRRPADRDLCVLDLLARQAADWVERAHADEALRESEERFRLTADAAPVLIWKSGADKLCTWFNKPWLDFVGRPMERELGNGWAENVHPDDFDRCLHTYTAAFDARRPFTMEYRLKRHDGEYRWVLDNGIPLHGAGAEFLGYIGSCTDITDHKRTEAALRDREARLAAVLDAAADSIITIDVRGTIQSVNVAAERMFGYAAAEMVGQNVTLLVPSPYPWAPDGYLERYLRTGEKHIIDTGREVLARRKDGKVFPAYLAVSAIESLGLFTGILHDLTRRKELERDVVEAASRQQRRIGEDLHDSVAQELTALSLLARDLAELLRTDPGSAAPLAERMDQGLQRSRRELRTVLRGLLPVAVDSGGLMAALADLADRTQREGKVACTLDCPETVGVEDNLVATHLYLIAQEAVHNAVKHGRPRAVHISLRSDPALVLRVEDDGAGMPGGSAADGGMGLRIMRNRAAIVGARLSIEPAGPAGTVVTCVLPGRTNGREKEEAGPGADRG